MRLYKREGSPFWWAEFFIGSKKHRISTKRLLSDKAGATQVMTQEYQKLMNRVQLGAKAEITLSAAMQLAVDSVEEGSTKTSYELSRRKWLGLDRFGDGSVWHLQPDLLLSALTQDDLDEHVSERRSEGLRANSINAEVRFMQKTYNLCRKKYVTNPDLEFSKPRSFKKTRYLSEPEVEDLMNRLWAKSNDPVYLRTYNLAVFLLDTGLRISEALSVDWFDINMTTRVIEVYRIKTSSLSTVPMSDRVYSILSGLSKKEKPFSHSDRPIKVLRKELKVYNGNPKIVAQRGNATIHTLRDTYATRLLKAGMTLKKVSVLLGHTSTAMTEKYAHLEQSDVAHEARELMR